MNDKKSILISIILIFIVLVVLIFAVPQNFEVAKDLVLEETYELKDIIIESNVSNIHIKHSDEQIIKVKIYGDKNRTKIDDYDKLSIVSKVKECKIFCRKNKIASIEITLPKDYGYKLKINNDYGNVSVDNFENGIFDVETDTGRVTIDEVKNLKLDVDVGDIIIGKINNKLDIEVDAGDLTIEEINLNENSIINIDTGNVKINKTNEIYFDTKVDVGKVDINNNYRKSDIELKIKLDVGNISIKN